MQTSTNPLRTPLNTENEAAAFLAIKPATLRRWRWAGQGPAFCKLGGAVRYRQQDLEAFLAGSLQTSTTVVEG